MNDPSVVTARTPRPHQIPLRRSFQSYLSFYFSTVPFLCCVPLSPQMPTGQHVFTLPMRHGLSPQQPATTLLTHPPTHPKRTIISLFSPQPADCPTARCSQKCAVVLLYGRTLKCHCKREGLLDSIRGNLAPGSALIHLWQESAACKTITAPLSVSLFCMAVLCVF